MPAFIATYTGPAGQSRSLTLKASDLSQARKLLRRRGIRAEELKPASDNKNDENGSSGLLSFDLNKLLEKPPGVKEKAVFASKLAALVDAGVPIVRSLDLMATQQKLPMFQRALMKVSLDVNEGIALGTAIRQWPKVFDELSIAMVEAGEAGGVLDEALKRLAKLLEDNAKLQNQIKGALGYPVAVLVIAILVFLGMTIFLIPTFAGIFEDLGAELPAFTQLLVNLSDLLRSSVALYAAGALLMAVWLTRRYYDPQRPSGDRSVAAEASSFWRTDSDDSHSSVLPDLQLPHTSRGSHSPGHGDLQPDSRKRDHLRCHPDVPLHGSGRRPAQHGTDPAESVA